MKYFHSIFSLGYTALALSLLSSLSIVSAIPATTFPRPLSIRPSALCPAPTLEAPGPGGKRVCANCIEDRYIGGPPECVCLNAANDDRDPNLVFNLDKQACEASEASKSNQQGGSTESNVNEENKCSIDEKQASAPDGQCVTVSKCPQNALYTFGCTCPNGLVYNDDANTCECPPGSTFNRATKKCDAPNSKTAAKPTQGQQAADRGSIESLSAKNKCSIYKNQALAPNGQCVTVSRCFYSAASVFGCICPNGLVYNRDKNTCERKADQQGDDWIWD